MPVRFSQSVQLLNPEESPLRRFPRSLDSKVRGLVLPSIHHTGGKTELLPSAMSTVAMPDLLSLFTPFFAFPTTTPRSSPSRRFLLGKRSAPIGLKRCDLHGWANAWAQFFLYLPKVSDLLAFVPRSLELLQTFVDQYRSDQEAGHPVSAANSSFLVRPLLHLFPSLQRKRIDPYEMFCLFFQMLSFYFQSTRLTYSFQESIPFHPEWHIRWHQGSLEEEVKKKIFKSPRELLVSLPRYVEERQCPVPKQLLAGNGCWYDLDQFIEFRPDQKLYTYVAYVKVEGVWYQCDDERVAILSSPLLAIPLQRGVLLHYQRGEVSLPHSRQSLR